MGLTELEKLINERQQAPEPEPSDEWAWMRGVVFQVPIIPRSYERATGHIPPGYDDAILRKHANESERALDEELWSEGLAGAPGWAGSLERFKRGIPLMGGVVAHTILDIPNQIYQRFRHGPQFGQYDPEKYKFGKKLYDLPMSIFTDLSEIQEGETLFKQEVKRGISKEMLLPWLTLFTGETGRDVDPVKAKGIISRWVEDKVITPEAAEEVAGFRTFGQYWYEDPAFVTLDALMVADPLLKLPLRVTGSIGKFGRVVQAGRRVVGEGLTTGTPSAQSLRALRGIPNVLDQYRRGILKWDEAMGVVDDIVMETQTTPGFKYGAGAVIEPATASERLFTGMAKVTERAPITIGTYKIPRAYSENIAHYMLQKSLEKLRSRNNVADNVLAWTEQILGVDPGQRLVDYFWRTLPQEATPAVAPVAARLRKSVAKIPDNEFEPFIEALEGMNRTPAGDVVFTTYVKQLSKDTVSALGEWKGAVKTVEAWYKRRGYDVSKADAAWTSRARSLFEKEMKDGGMTQKKIDEKWASYTPDEVRVWRAKAKHTHQGSPTIEEWIASAKEGKPGWYKEYVDVYWRRWTETGPNEFNTKAIAPSLEQAYAAYRVDISKGIPKKASVQVPEYPKYVQMAEELTAQAEAFKEFTRNKPAAEGFEWYHVDDVHYFPHWEKPIGLLQKLKESTDSVFRTDRLVPRRTPSSMKFRAGTRDFIKNPKIAAEILVGELQALERDRLIIQQLNEFRVPGRNGQPIVLRGNQKVPDGFVAYNPSLRLRLAKSKIETLSGVQDALSRGEDLSYALWDGLKRVFPDERSVYDATVKGGEMYLLPKNVARRFQAHVGRGVPLWWKTYRNAWVNSTLVGMFWSRWMLNNFVGNIAMGVLDNSLWKLPKAVKWRYSREMQEAIPANLGGGGFADAVRGKANLHLYDTATVWGKTGHAGARLIENLYNGNAIVDELVRGSAFIKRIEPQLKRHMLLKGYRDHGPYFMDNIGKLNTDELAVMLRGMKEVEPQLFHKIGLDVSRNVYDFALKTPLEKLMSAYTHPFISWWKFQNSWVMHMAVGAPGKLAMMNILGNAGRQIVRTQWAAMGVNPDRLPKEYRDAIPVETFTGPDGKKKARFLMFRGANFLYETFDISTLTVGLSPPAKFTLETATRYDTYRQGPISSPYWMYGGSNAEKAVPEEYRDEDFALWKGNRAWSLFTDVVPYGNIAEFIYKANRPYAEFPTASPFSEPQPYIEGATVKYEYKNDWITLMLRVLGIPLRESEVRHLREKYATDVRGAKAVKMRLRKMDKERARRD